MATGKLPAKSNDDQPFSLHELVRVVSHARNVLPETLWNMTIQDLWLFAESPQETNTFNAGTFMGWALVHDDWQRMLNELSEEETLALEEWKQRACY